MFLNGATSLEDAVILRDAAREWIRLLVLALFLGVASIVASIPASADTVRFAKLVQFKAHSAAAQMAGATGSLATNTTASEIQMRLTNVAVGGTTEAQELVTKVNAKSLQLNSSIIADVVKGHVVRVMRKKRQASSLDGKDTDVFVYSERSDNNRETVSEPFIEYKVADFLSVMLIAADALKAGKTTPINLSMLRDRSVTHVVMKFGGSETVDGVQARVVHVASPKNPQAGITYLIGRTAGGEYYPALLRVGSHVGMIELKGTPL